MDTIHVTAGADALRDRAAQLIEAGRIGAARPLLAAARALALQLHSVFQVRALCGGLMGPPPE